MLGTGLIETLREATQLSPPSLTIGVCLGSEEPAYDCNHEAKNGAAYFHPSDIRIERKHKRKESLKSCKGEEGIRQRHVLNLLQGNEIVVVSIEC